MPWRKKISAASAINDTIPFFAQIRFASKLFGATMKGIYFESTPNLPWQMFAFARSISRESVDTLSRGLPQFNC